MFAKQLRDITHEQSRSDAGQGATRPGGWHSSTRKGCVGHSIPTHVEIKLNFT